MGTHKSEKLSYIDYKPLLDRFVEGLSQCFGENLVSIILYGSVARGMARPTSDVDLLLVIDNAPESYFERLDPISSIIISLRDDEIWKKLEAKGVTPELNPLVFSREEADQNRYIYLDMIEEARFLVDRDNFFRDRLRKLKKRLDELGAKKVPINGNWYWDLKPDLKPGETLIL